MQLFSFLKKDFVKNVITLLTGSLISQVIIYASILYLTRLFSKELFGVYMLFSSIILILKPLVSLQFELAIILPKRDKDAANILVFSLITLLLSNFILWSCIFFFKKEILLFFEIEKLTNFIYLLPLSSFLFGCINTLNYWNNRVKLFKNIATGAVIKSSFMSTTQISTGLSIFNGLGLIPGLILGQITQSLFLLKKTYKIIIKHKKNISFKRMCFLARKYKDIPLFNTLISFSNTLSNEIPILLITKYFGFSYSGVYGLAIKIGKAPASIILDPIKQVFYNKATDVYNNKGDLNQLIKETSKYLLKIAFLIFIPIISISFFLDFIFGEKWNEVGLYLRILTPWLFVIFFSYPLTSLILILNKQKIILFYDILLLTSRFLAFYIGYHFFNNILISITLFSTVGVIFNAFILLYFFKITKNKTNLNIPYK